MTSIRRTTSVVVAFACVAIAAPTPAVVADPPAHPITPTTNRSAR